MTAVQMYARSTFRRFTLAGASLAVGLGAAATCTSCGPSKEPPSQAQNMELDKADPQTRIVLDQLKKDGGTSFSRLSVSQARSGPTAQMAAMEVAKAQGKNEPLSVGSIFNQTVAGRGGNNITLHCYAPSGDGPFPLLVYYHGGGWVVGAVTSANPYDGSCRVLSNMARCVVVEVDYRLAPENPYPAAVNDSYDALKSFQAHQDQFKGNGQVAVGGESAGGNLAVAVSLMAKDNSTPLPAGILSVYPVGGYYVDTPSAKENAVAVPLDTASLVWFYNKYVPNPADRTARYFDILRADLHGLPPTTVITDQIDPLMSDGKMLADRLTAAGVQTRYQNYDGVTHEFFGMGDVVDTAMKAETFAVDGLKAAWAANAR